MTFEEITTGILEDDATLAALVSGRVFFGSAPQGVQEPFVVCRRVGTDPTLSTDNGQPGSFELDNIRLEVGCYARGHRAANNLARACRRALEAHRPTVYILQDQLADYSDLPNLHQMILDFSCWHQDSIPLTP
jgi:hypothetical protein